MLIDTHCHLDFADFEEERDAIVARAHEVGVRQMVTISTRVRKLEGLIALTERYPSVFCSVGTHPNSADQELDIQTEDLVRLARFSSYWREGPVGNNAISGLDQALWDIAGKRAGLPVYELLGGRVRAAADTYLHAEGPTIAQALDQAELLRDRGLRHVRIQVGASGAGHYGARPTRLVTDPDAPYPQGWQVSEYLASVPRLFEAARERLGAIGTEGCRGPGSGGGREAGMQHRIGLR